MRDSPDLSESNTFLAKSHSPPPASNPNLEKYISLTESALSSLPIPHTYPNLFQTKLKALHTLRRMKDLTIRKEDKGSCIVVEDTSSYIDNRIAHLQNTSIYRMLLGDPHK